MGELKEKSFFRYRGKAERDGQKYHLLSHHCLEVAADEDNSAGLNMPGHPHACGEHLKTFTLSKMSPGSSPIGERFYINKTEGGSQ